VTFASVERKGFEREREREDSSGADRGSRDASKAPRASSHGGSIADLPTPIFLSAHLRLSFRLSRNNESSASKREREKENGDANDGQQRRMA